MSTGSALLHLLSFRDPEHPLDIGSTGEVPARPRTAQDLELACHLAKLRFGTEAAFLFDSGELIATGLASATLADDIFRAQARRLASYASTLQPGLSIDDIYAHPLVRKADILSGHCMRAFIAAPVWGPGCQPIAVLCAADTKVRRWQRADLTDLQQIIAQTGGLHLSQF